MMTDFFRRAERIIGLLAVAMGTIALVTSIVTSVWLLLIASAMLFVLGYMLVTDNQY